MNYPPVCPICGESVADYKGPCPKPAHPLEDEEVRDKPMSRQMRVWLRDEKRRAEHRAPPPPPPQGDHVDAALHEMIDGRDATIATLRQRADEAARTENEGIVAVLRKLTALVEGSEAKSLGIEAMAAIRARIAPKGSP